MSTPSTQQQQEDTTATYRKTQSAVRNRGYLLGDAFGVILYLVTWHQILHCIAFANNATNAPLSLVPLPISRFLTNPMRVWLEWFISTVFPGAVDMVSMVPPDLVPEDPSMSSIPTTSKNAFVNYDLSAMLVNMLLFVPLILQHSFTRLAFEHSLNSYSPRWVERAAYPMLSALAFQMLFFFWRSMPVAVWNFTLGGWLEYPIAVALQGLWTGGMMWTLAAMYSATSFDIFGHRETFSGRAPKPFPDRPPLMYRLCRNPVFFGMLVCLWATPVMTQGRLVLAAGMTMYSLLTSKWLETDLVNRFGRKYADYRQQVPFLFPSIPA